MQPTMQSSQQDTTLDQKIAITANLALFLAMPIILLIRNKPGYRFVSPFKLLIPFVLLNVLTVFGGVSGNSASVVLLQIFAWGTLILGLVKRHARWREISSGVSWHTYSRGVPLISSFVPLSESNIKRWVEPIGVIVIGALLALAFPLFGYYLVIAGFSLFLFEAWDYEQTLNRMLDILDGLVDGEVMNDNVEYYSQPNPQQRPVEETAGIPTGIAPDLEAQIQRRKARKAVTLNDFAVAPAVTASRSGDNLPGAAF